MTGSGSPLEKISRFSHYLRATLAHTQHCLWQKLLDLCSQFQPVLQNELIIFNIFIDGRVDRIHVTISSIYKM